MREVRVSGKWAGLASWVAAMQGAINDDDAAALATAMARLDAARTATLQAGVGKVGAELQDALQAFLAQAHLGPGASGALRDAQLRLAQVLRVNDDATHRAQDLLESCCPSAEQTGASAAALLAQWHAERDAQSVSAHAIESFLDQTVRNMTIVRNGLAEVLLVQGSQEITGQVVRGVMNLLDELDAAIATLARLAGRPAVERGPAAAPAHPHRQRATHPAAGDVADVNAWLLKSGS